MSHKKGLVDEKSLVKVRRSRKVYLPIYLMVIAIIILIIYMKINSLYMNKYVLITAGVFILISIKGTELHRLLSYYQITSHYIVYSKGLITKNVQRIFLPTITDIVLKQNVWQRVLNYGTLDIHRFTEGAIIEVKHINDPTYFLELLENKLNESKK